MNEGTGCWNYKESFWQTHGAGETNIGVHGLEENLGYITPLSSETPEDLQGRIKGQKSTLLNF